MSNTHDHLSEEGREGNGLGPGGKKKKTGYTEGIGPYGDSRPGRVWSTWWLKWGRGGFGLAGEKRRGRQSSLFR